MGFHNKKIYIQWMEIWIQNSQIHVFLMNYACSPEIERGTILKKARAHEKNSAAFEKNIMQFLVNCILPSFLA
jgi:S-methylmethionine-dependent homocysteine/selenocysteine methylase